MVSRKLMLLLGVIGVIALVAAGIAWGDKANGMVERFEKTLTSAPETGSKLMSEVKTDFADMGEWVTGRNEMSPLLVMLIVLAAMIIGVVLVKVDAFGLIRKGVKKSVSFAEWVITKLSRRAVIFTLAGIPLFFGVIIGSAYAATALGDTRSTVIAWSDNTVRWGDDMIESVSNPFEEEPKKATSEAKKIEAAPKDDPTPASSEAAPKDDPTSEPTPVNSASEKATPKGEPTDKEIAPAKDKKADADKSVMEQTNDWANSPFKVNNVMAVGALVIMGFMVLIIGLLVLRQRAIDNRLDRMERNIRSSRPTLTIPRQG